MNKTAIESTLIWLEHNDYNIDDLIHDAVLVNEAAFSFAEWLGGNFTPITFVQARMYVESAVTGEVDIHE
jgi:hypothetical protein